MTMETLSEKKKMFILAGVLLVMFLASMDSTIVSTAMPQVINNLNGMEYYTWPFTIYMLCTAVFIPIAGKMADTFGFKKLFFIGVGVFLGGSALCGVSSNIMQLILFRGLQGIGAGILSANMLAIIGATFSPVERAKYLGLGSSVYAIASIVGPALGGYITDFLSWRWIFYINIPVGIVAMVFIFFTLPGGKINNDKTEEVDYLGIVIFILFIVPLLLALTLAGEIYSWNSLLISGMLVFSAIMLIAFLFVEKKSSQPLIPLDLFKNSIFSLSSLNMLFLNGVIIGVVIFVPLFGQGILGSNASDSGAILTPLMFSMVVASGLCGIIISRTKKYKLPSLVGILFILVGLFLLSTLTPDSKNYMVALILVLTGAGLGFSLPTFNIAVQNAFPKEQVGTVTSALQFFRLLGTTIFSAIFGMILITSMEARINTIDFRGLPDNMTEVLKQPLFLTDRDAINNIKSALFGEQIDVFNSLYKGLEFALSNSIRDIFIFCTILVILSLIMTFLLKELPMQDKIKV